MIEQYQIPTLEYRKTVNGYGLYVKKVWSSWYVCIARCSDHRKAAEFDAPYCDGLRALDAAFLKFGSDVQPCPENDAEFTPERIADARRWRMLLVKNSQGKYVLPAA